jgi:RNA 2',3'-cyclic 3'-phosphodiesterase
MGTRVRSEGRGQKSDVRGQRSDAGFQISEETARREESWACQPARSIAICRRMTQGNWFVAWPALIDPQWLDNLRTMAPRELRWFAHEDLHLTLAFLGPIPTERCRAVIAELQAVPAPPSRLVTGGLRLLPNERRFSALSFSLTGAGDELASLIAAHRDRFSDAAGAARETRPPLPHLTVARPKKRAAPDQRRAIAKWAADLSVAPASIRLGALSLFAWASDRLFRQFQIIAVAGKMQS